MPLHLQLQNDVVPQAEERRPPTSRLVHLIMPDADDHDEHHPSLLGGGIGNSNQEMTAKKSKTSLPHVKTKKTPQKQQKQLEQSNNSNNAASFLSSSLSSTSTTARNYRPSYYGWLVQQSCCTTILSCNHFLIETVHNINQQLHTLKQKHQHHREERIRECLATHHRYASNLRSDDGILNVVDHDCEQVHHHLQQSHEDFRENLQ